MGVVADIRHQRQCGQEQANDHQHPRQAADADFSAYGTVHSMAAPGAPEGEARLVRFGAGLDRHYGRAFAHHQWQPRLHAGRGRALRHRQDGAPFRHAGSAVLRGQAVLAVAAPTDAARPKAVDIRAFIIEPGTVVVMHKGTWHDACRGIDAPTHYYWMATCGFGSVSMSRAGGM